MIEDLRGLAVFVAVAEAGSLTAAGKRLKLSTSVISHHLSRLEDRLGVTLFFRSTRSMSLTAEGHAALLPAQRMVTAGHEALGVLSEGKDEPVGALRISMPAFGEQAIWRQALWDFAKQHPLVAVSLQSSDAPADLIKEGIDLAVRLGVLADSALKSRKISSFRRYLVASPDYLKNRAPIETLDDLASCDFVALSMLPSTVTLQRAGQAVTFEPENIRIEVDKVSTAVSAVRSGLGIRELPEDEIGDDLKQGRLLRVLTDWHLPDLGVFAVWPDSGPQKALTRRLIDFLLARISEVEKERA